MKEHDISIRRRDAYRGHKKHSVQYEEEYCLCIDTDKWFYTDEQKTKNHTTFIKAYEAELINTLGDEEYMLFRADQLEVIYRAVKTCYQETYLKTLTNDELSLSLRDIRKKHIREYNEIMKMINEHTDNVLEEI